MLQTLSPIDGRIYAQRNLATEQELHTLLQTAQSAQRDWKHVSIHERAKLCQRWVDFIVSERDAIAEEITWQIGRPIAQSPGEVRGFEERARYMISVAEQQLADQPVDNPRPGFQRFIRREPLGVVFSIAAWNYPYLIAVNSIIPAIMAGNTVLLKHSAQTPLCAERLFNAAQKAGLPNGVFAFVHASHELTLKTVQHPAVSYVAFTGSVAGGHAIQQAAAQRFIGTGLELGGKDPAYVRPDLEGSSLQHAIDNLVDGAFFNSGQSCCGIERIYVHHAIYDRFIEGYVALTEQYRLGNPLDPQTNLGPVVRASAARSIQQQIDQAMAQGAKALIDTARFQVKDISDSVRSLYLAPQVLVNVNHNMSVMRDETFGPVVGIMPVRSDEEAIALMNDSPFGLTASVWTNDTHAALSICNQIETGTCFMNRCDYLDPALAWVGVKDSGRGCTLSPVGYEFLTRPKSFHFKMA